MIKDRETLSNENRKNWNQKGFKGQNYHAKNEIIQTLETPGLNDSPFETNKNGYKESERHISKP